MEAPPFPWNADPVLKKRESELEALLAQGPPQRGTKSAPITWLFDPESFAPMAKLVDGEQLAILTDHLGTPVLMANARGQRVWSANTSVYGELRDLEGERHACPFRWPGQYEDLETGLYYNRFRYYDPEAGQYASQDPIGLAGGSALYGYVHDPLAWLDPWGLSACKSGDAEFGRLTALGGGRWKSSAGLTYGQGSIHGNRVKHVLAHAAPDASKPNHSVFLGGRTNTLPLIDEAWSNRGPGIVQGNGNTLYRVAMERTVGRSGETSFDIVIKKGTASEVIPRFRRAEAI